jgi:hypothetical protein
MMNEKVENLSRHQDDKIGFFIIDDTTGYISKLGLFKVFPIKERLKDKNEEPFFIGSTDTELSCEEIIEYYSKRWAIETFYEVSKENFGFDQYQMRKGKGIKRHSGHPRSGSLSSLHIPTWP